MRRFFVPAGVLGGEKVTLPPELSRRLAAVLRLQRGDRVVLAGGGSREFEVELTSVSARAVECLVVGEMDPPPEPAVELTLYQCLVRPQRFELVLEKCTELGVSRFVPVLSGRVQVKTEGGSQRAERWRRIVTEAAEQCERGRLPDVEEPQRFEEALRSAPGLRLLSWEGERKRGLGGYLRGLKERPSAVSLLIGPEGGLSDDEAAAAVAAGWTAVTLGRRVLRSETAAIVAVAIVMQELGELG